MQDMKSLESTLKRSEQKVWLEERLCLEFQFESSSVMFSVIALCEEKMIGDNKNNLKAG